MARLSNPLAFTSGPVTIITSLVYIAIITVLIIIQTGVPLPPRTPTPFPAINLTEAWNDLQLLSAEFRPYNSRRNDFTRSWLLKRIDEIINSNNASSDSVYVFDDKVSNLTFTSAGSLATVYHEGLNIVVYIRGSKDEKGEWWNSAKGTPSQRGGVLVNAHFDSVSTGFGATDDGVGVVTILQLLRFYTKAPSNVPKNGLVLLLNNGEEDYLNGASVFSQHPMSKFVSSFLNLEGAGAGGRAALFRSTDEEVTQAYAHSPYPFGTVLSGDAFNRGLVRSQTDYVVLNGKMGMRGLDVAFIEPRARYHTDQDDSRHTGRAAVWHMLSAALETTKVLTNSSPRVDDKNDPPHAGIWFDLFGRFFLCIQTHTFFALSVTALVVGPILLFATLAILYRADKLYLLSSSRKIHTIEDEEIVSFNGWRGFFRHPLIFAFACAAPVALAYLLFKLNPYIAHGNEWAVWAMMVSSFIFVAWFFARALDYARPSVLTRAYGFSWLCVMWWVVLVAATVFEEQFHLAGGYFALFYFACALVTTFLSYLECFSLPKKSKFCATKLGDLYPISRSRSVSRPVSRHSRQSAHDEADPAEADVEEEDATERSSLLRSRGRSAFKNYGRTEDYDNLSQHSKKTQKEPSQREQEWSQPMWTWLWVLQFLILAPLNIIILGQLGFFLVASLHQTGQDGSSMFVVYLGMAIISILVLLPTLPVMHRFTWHIPMFLLLVLIATIIYNLLAFPFSPQSRLKLFFQQEIDLNTGANNVSLSGVPDFLQDAISFIPSAAGQRLHCDKPPGATERQRCVWSGPLPQVAGSSLTSTFKPHFKNWLNYNVSLTHKKDDERSARFVLYGKDTRACKIVFDSPITNVYVAGQAPYDERFPHINEGQTNEVRLWHREWDRAWTVDVSWISDQQNSSMTGKVVCLWSDANRQGVIPALDEVKHFVPDWVAITKFGDGLVEGYKRFSV